MLHVWFTTGRLYLTGYCTCQTRPNVITPWARFDPRAWVWHHQKKKTFSNFFCVLINKSKVKSMVWSAAKKLPPNPPHPFCLCFCLQRPLGFCTSSRSWQWDIWMLFTQFIIINSQHFVAPCVESQTGLTQSDVYRPKSRPHKPRALVVAGLPPEFLYHNEIMTRLFRSACPQFLAS